MRHMDTPLHILFLISPLVQQMLCRKSGYDMTYILDMCSDLDTMAVEYLD